MSNIINQIKTTVTNTSSIALDFAKETWKMPQTKINTVVASLTAMIGIQTIAETGLTFSAFVQAGAIGGMIGFTASALTFIGVLAIAGLKGRETATKVMGVMAVVCAVAAIVSAFAIGYIPVIAATGYSLVAGLLTGIAMPTYWITHLYLGQIRGSR